MLAQDTHAPKTVHGAQWGKKASSINLEELGSMCFFLFWNLRNNKTQGQTYTASKTATCENWHRSVLKFATLTLTPCISVLKFIQEIFHTTKLIAKNMCKQYDQLLDLSCFLNIFWTQWIWSVVACSLLRFLPRFRIMIKNGRIQDGIIIWINYKIG